MKSIQNETFRQLHGKKKIQYIWDYYKFPLLILCVLIYIFVYSIYRHLSHKDIILYTAFVNVSTGEDLTKELSDGFLEFQTIDTKKNKIYLYSGLYLTENEANIYYKYTYASQIKILAAIDGEQLDVVFMNQEAFDAFSQNGYLCDLSQLLIEKNSKLYERLRPFLITNLSILEDNPIGLDLSQSPIIQKAGFQETVYLGIIANSSRKDCAVSYLQYLFP